MADRLRFGLHKQVASFLRHPGAERDRLISPNGRASRSLAADDAARPQTLAACFAFVAAHPDVPDVFRGQLRATQSHVERDLCRAADELPADPIALRPLLLHHKLRRKRLKGTRWNAYRMLRSVLILTGWVTSEAGLRSELPAPWEPLLVIAEANDKRRELAGFFRYCLSVGIRPEAINSTTLAGYLRFLIEQTLDLDPRETALAARAAWEFMRASQPAWPQQKLEVPPLPKRVEAAESEPDQRVRIGGSGLANRSLVDDVASRPPTLAACFSFVEGRAEVPSAFRSEIPAVRARLEQLLGQPVEDLPADPVELRPILARIRLSHYPTNHKRWNAASILQSVLVISGWVPLESRTRDKLPDDWERLLIAADHHGKRRSLAAFLRHCHRTGIRLDAINTGTLLGYIGWLAQHTQQIDPWKVGLRTALAWRLMRSNCAQWPRQQLDLPAVRKSAFADRVELRTGTLIGPQRLPNRSVITDPGARPIGLAACLDLAATHPQVSRSFRRDALGAKTLLKRVTGKDPADLPTEPSALRPVLAAVRPIEFKISNKRWKNVQAVVRSALILCGWLSTDSRKRPLLPDRWASLLASAALHKLDRPLAPFFRFCQRASLTPETITTHALDLYKEWVERETLRRDAWRTVYLVKRAWKRMQQRDPGWPTAELSLPSRLRFKRRTDFAAAFYEDIRAYLDSLRRYNLRDPTYRRPVSERTISIVRTCMLRGATYLVAAGMEVEAISGVATLVEPENFEKILLTALEDAGGQWNVLAKHIANNLVVAAKRWVKPSAEVLADLDEQRSSVHLLESNRRRRDLMAQFGDPHVVKALFELPERAFEQAETMLKEALRAKGHQPLQAPAKLHETALALMMLLTQPLRAGNLVALDLRKHFQTDHRGRFNRIFIEPGAVKNSVAIEFWLPEPLLRRIERHLNTFRPILLKGTISDALFPGRAGQPMNATTIAPRIRRLVEQQLGLRFTPHLARHLAAELLLDKDVNNLRVAQRLLGHARPETTEHVYGLVRTGAAQKVYAKLIEEDVLNVPQNQRRKRRNTRHVAI